MAPGGCRPSRSDAGSGNLSIQQAMVDYKRLGYSDNWINQRLKAIEVRKDLTDAWKKRGVQEGQQFATLTDIITNVWSGFTTREYKAYKGLRKENLRDNMTNTELILNQLAEALTKEHNRGNRPSDACSTQSGRATRRHNCPQCPAGTRSKNRPQGGFSVECTSGITNREDGRGGIADRR